MQLPLYQVDAFTDRLFGGNPAAVMPLERWLPDATLQAIAEENALSETAFLVPEEGSAGGHALRWFTPEREVDLCGHATLASAYVLLEVLDGGDAAASFSSRSGPLTVRRLDDGRLELDFPALPPRPVDPVPLLEEGLRARPAELLRADESADGGNYLAVFSDAAAVAALAPDFERLRELEGFGVIATAPGEDVDFVSRYFAAWVGIPEDPVTGSAHCALAPFWGERLGKGALSARQISRRGGALACRLEGERVRIAGHARLYLRGTVHLDDALARTDRGETP